MVDKLLAFDTDHIKDYVFATGALREIRGASALLDRLNRWELPAALQAAAPAAQMTFAHGGAALAVVPAAQAAAAQAAVVRLYSDNAETASITGAAAPLPDERTVTTSIKDTYRLLSYRLRAAKGRTPTTVALTTHALLRPCARCGDEYASHDQWLPGEGHSAICQGCARKINENDRVKIDARNPQLAPAKAEPQQTTLWQRLLAQLQGFGWETRATRPETFDALGDLSTPQGYFGLIYADGDGIGRQLERQHTLEDLSAFATGLDEAMHYSAAAAIHAHLRPASEQTTLGFDLLFLGGDDLVMVTTAQAAIEAAATLLSSYGKVTQANACTGRQRMSACVVLAHTSYPFSALRALADDGLRFAKREAARRPGCTDGLITFVVASGTTFPTFGEYYDQVLRDEPARRHHRATRTLRPYTPAEISSLVRAIRALGGGSRSRIHHLAEACERDYYGAIVDARQALLRWSAGAQDGAAVLEDLLRELATTRHDELALDTFPWLTDRREGETHPVFTPFVDVADLFDFVATPSATPGGLPAAPLEDQL